jgi:hypothetical protein
MKLAVMQPYFMPYIGYFQLIAAADVFVIYDNIKYTKKGWINRNRLLLNGRDATFTLPLKRAPDALNVIERELAADFRREKLLNQFRGAYSKAPYFADVFPLLERIVMYEEDNLFRYIHHAIKCLCDVLRIGTTCLVASRVRIDHELKGTDRVIALCRSLGADVYINPIGGVKLYSKDEFRAEGIDLRFLQAAPFAYKQYDKEFVPWLSMIDVLMFNPIEKVIRQVTQGYDYV